MASQPHYPAANSTQPRVIAGRTAPSARFVPWIDLFAEAGFYERWRALAAAASEPNPFLMPWGLEPALRALDPDGRCEIAVVERGGDMIGLLPLSRDGLYYGYPLPHLVNLMHDHAFVGAPLVCAGEEEAFWAALLDRADSSAPWALFFHLTHLDADGPLFASLQRHIRDGSRHAAIVHREERALLQSNLTSDAYLAAALSSKKRKELRRQFRRLEEEGPVAFVRQDGCDDITDWSTTFLAIEQAGWKGRNGSALADRAATAALFSQTLAGAAEAGQLERISLTLAGNTIAMLANFIVPPGAFAYKTTYDERYARFSPGVLLQRENLALLDRQDVDWCDSCAAPDHPMIDHIWQERRRLVRVSLAIGGPTRQMLAQRILKRDAVGDPERQMI